MECFKPLIEKFNQIYEKYPEYPVADAGYGSFNNYLYCEEHGMKKYMRGKKGTVQTPRDFDQLSLAAAAAEIAGEQQNGEWWRHPC